MISMHKKPIIINNFVSGALIVLGLLFSGCASVPLASSEADQAAKKFTEPTNGTASVYIYRNSFVGQGLSKTLRLDNQPIGDTANMVYFHRTVKPGQHQISTESEFGYNTLNFTANAGMTYFFEQYIKMGAFVGGSNLKEVPKAEGKSSVLKCHLAQ